MASESEILRAAHLRLGQRDDMVIWRNTTGAGIVVEKRQLTDILAMIPNAMPAHWKLAQLLANARYVRHGLCPGSSDLIGLRKPDGLFVALEAKAPHGRVAPEQERFISLVRSMGGIAGVFRSPEEAEALVSVK